MRLRKAQKEAVLSWVAEGLQSDEINARASTFEPPFTVSRQQVDFYRTQSEVRFQALREAGAHAALSEGYAVRAYRVQKLQQLAALMERDLFGGFLWTEQTKSIGSGPGQRIVDYEEFNAAEVTQYRGVLDDIARELGERQARQLNTNLQVDWDQVPDDLRDAFIDGRITLDDVLRKLQR